MIQLGEDFWVVERPLSFLGIEMGTRMSVARMDDALWVCSPVALDDELRAALDALGRVRWIVAPNRYHHLYVAPFARAYPDAAVLSAPGLQARRPELSFTGVLHGGIDDWDGTIDCVRAEGVPFYDELLFCHRPSGTLVATDFLLNVSSRASASLRLTAWLDGTYGQLAVPRTTKHLFLRDRMALRSRVEEMLSWSFDQVVLAHGELLREDGAEHVAAAFRWLTSS